MLWALLATVPSLTIYAHEVSVVESKATNRKIQALLYLKGLYQGPINGNCDKATIQSLESFRATLDNNGKLGFAVQCSSQTFDMLKQDIVARDGGADPAPQKDRSAVDKEISDLKTNVTNERLLLEALTAKFGDQFGDQFKNLATIGVTTLITAMSILIAFIAFIGNVAIKDAVKSAHEEEIKNTKKELSEMIEIAQPQMSATIHTSLSSSFTYLYNNLDPKNHRHLYNPYIVASVDMAKLGYDKSQDMYQLIRKNRKGQKEQEPTFTDAQVNVMDVALNNYAYFLADMTTLKEADGTPTPEAERAKDTLRTLLPKLEKTLVKVTDSTQSALGRYPLMETIVWTKLHLGKNGFKDFDEMFAELTTNPVYSAAERNRMVEKYAKHQSQFPELWQKI